MDKNLNNSFDNIEEPRIIIQVPENQLEKKSFEKDIKTEGNIIFSNKLKFNIDENSSLEENEEIKSNYFIKTIEEKSISRNGLIDNTNSTRTKRILKNKTKGSKIIKNLKFDNSYIIDDNLFSDENNTIMAPNNKVINNQFNTLPIKRNESQFSGILKLNKFNRNNDIKTKTIDDSMINVKERQKKKYFFNLKDSVKQLHQKKTKDSYNENNEHRFKCIFCDKISNNEKYNSYFSCSHFFCKKCGKIFYEDNIDTMITKNNFTPFLKCPIIDCPKKISLSLLKSIISEKYYNQFMINLDKNKNEMSNRKLKNQKDITIMKTETISTKKYDEIIHKNRVYNESNKYLQKNIIDLNSHNKYIYYIKKSFIRCSNCKEYSIYSGIEGNYDRCLKCMSKYCKYCHQIFENSHLDITKITHCKVFYRIEKKFWSQYFWYRYLIILLIVIGGYLFVLTFFIIRIKKEIKNPQICKRIMIICICFILFFLFLPICLLILPYFPMIISL